MSKTINFNFLSTFFYLTRLNPQKYHSNKTIGEFIRLDDAKITTGIQVYLELSKDLRKFSF